LYRPHAGPGIHFRRRLNEALASRGDRQGRPPPRRREGGQGRYGP